MDCGGRGRQGGETKGSYACRPEQEDNQTGSGQSSSNPLKNAGPLQGWGEVSPFWAVRTSRA